MQPFNKHPADVAALEQSADELMRLAAEATELAGATRRAYQPAVGNWHGMAAPEMASAGEPLQHGAQQMRQDLAWSAIADRYWAAKVKAFNAEVDTITGGLASKAADGYGATGTDGKPPTDAQIADARGAATAAAKQQWMQSYDTHIDTGRHETASMLQRGPTEANLIKLRDADVLPGDGVNPLPDLWDATKGLVLPAAFLGPLGIPALVANLGLTGLGVASQWATLVKYGAYKPMGYRASGRYGYLSHKTAPRYKRLRAKHYAAKKNMKVPYNRWRVAGKVGGYAGGALTGATSAYEQWSRDSGRTDLNTSEKVGRAGTRGLAVGVGAWGGAAAGASIGAAAGPVGAVVGGVVGGVIGSGVGNEIADHTIEYGGKFAEGVTNVAEDGFRAVNPFD